MIRLLRAIFIRPSRKPAPESIKKLGIELTAIDGALLEEKHYPRPQWKVIHLWVKEHVSAEDLAVAWQEIVFGWLSTLKDRLGESYHVRQSPNFFLLTSKSLEASKAILRTSESAVLLLTHWLGRVAEKRGYGKHVILDFATIEDYYDYVSYFYASESSVRASGGVFLKRGYQHIALPPADRTQEVLIHELSHNRLAHLPLPDWLNEGISVTMERKIGGKKHGKLDRELHGKHRDYWTPETITAFWTGDSFDDIDGEIIRLSYSLADIFVDLLVQEFPNFTEFVAHANRNDAGQAASQQYFGVSLNDVASTFLGPGDWISGFTALKSD